MSSVGLQLTVSISKSAGYAAFLFCYSWFPNSPKPKDIQVLSRKTKKANLYFWEALRSRGMFASFCLKNVLNDKLIIKLDVD